MLQFLGHHKLFYKTCMCAVKVALNFLPIRKNYYKYFSYLTVFQDSGLDGEPEQGGSLTSRRSNRNRWLSADLMSAVMAALPHGRRASLAVTRRSFSCNLAPTNTGGWVACAPYYSPFMRGAEGEAECAAATASDEPSSKSSRSSSTNQRPVRDTSSPYHTRTHI